MNAKKKILFVDDEPNVLAGLRRMLRGLRDEWEMSFADGGRAAVELLQSRPIDVLVTDMRMPDMNGLELLEWVKVHQPYIARVALSGQTSKEKILRSVGPTHQYLSKPCDAETLKRAIDRLGSLHRLLHNESLQGLVAQMESLPCLSSVYTQLMQTLQSQECSAKAVGEIIGQDIAMSAKILQLVNSAFFGVRQRITGIPQAVGLLGLDTIKSLALSIKIFTQFPKQEKSHFILSDLWDHSLQVGQWSRAIAQQLRAEPPSLDNALLAGMLHDVGKLILATQLPEQYETVMERSETDHLTSEQAEKEILGNTHAEIGAYLLGLWGFHHEIIDALSYHHRPSEAQRPASVALTAVYAANWLSREQESADNPDGPREPLDGDYLAGLGLADHLEPWRNRCRSAVSVPG
ncbi:MAG: HDOD domain-containing protein [Sedimentisphaerales bacterium]|nr:HDOD domain-containing protein [Sedimentisphaerales bacterium]